MIYFPGLFQLSTKPEVWGSHSKSTSLRIACKRRPLPVTPHVVPTDITPRKK